MKKKNVVIDNSADLFDESGAALISVSTGALARRANEAAPCQFNKKMPPLTKSKSIFLPFGISKQDLKDCKDKLARQAKWLKSQEFISDVTGEFKTLFDYCKSANLSPTYYAELNNRVNTISDFMANKGLKYAFLTITLNGCFRKALIGDYSTFKENDLKMLSLDFRKKLENSEPCSVRDLVDLLNFQWHGYFKRVFKYLKGQEYFYIRAFEPHKRDGVPHIHALFAYPAECHYKILNAFKDIFNAPQNLKNSALSKEQKENGEINGFQWSLNNPTGYVLKYINKSFVNHLEGGELNENQAWYVKYKVRRFTSSRHQVPLWIYRKINFFKKDFYDLCTFAESPDWICEWDYNTQYFRFENVKTDEKIICENGELLHTFKNTLLHRYKKKVYKVIHKKLVIPDRIKENKLIPASEYKKPINRMKDFEFMHYFKHLTIESTPHYALCINELIKRKMNGIFGIAAKKINLNNAAQEINPFDYI